MAYSVTQIEEIRIIAVYPTANMHFFVQWEIEQSAVGGGPFNFKIYRSGSPEGPWELIKNNAGEVYSYEDVKPEVQGMNTDVWYKVTSGSLSSAPRSVLHNLPLKKYLIWRKMVRDEDVMLRKGNGRQIAIAKRKHWGVRCKECWDSRSGKVIKKLCLSCFGTAFEGGYFAPINVWATIKPGTPGTDFSTDSSVPEVETCNMMIQNYPIIRRGDIVIEKEINFRWEITTEQPTELLRNPVHQDITISRLPINHMVYSLVVP